MNAHNALGDVPVSRFEASRRLQETRQRRTISYSEALEFS